MSTDAMQTRLLGNGSGSTIAGELNSLGGSDNSLYTRETEDGLIPAKKGVIAGCIKQLRMAVYNGFHVRYAAATNRKLTTTITESPRT